LYFHIYKSLTKLDRKDYENWAIGLKSAGYATDKKYAEKLIAIIEYFKLDRFDQ
jgi:flagellum-specific peptidoglycan hydrolase FlgJ